MRRALLAAAIVVVSCLGSARPAAADSLVIRQVDTTKFPAVTLSVMVAGDVADVADISVRENGEIVSDIEIVPIGETATPVGIVLVIDTSGSMKGAKLEAAKTAAREFIVRKQSHEQVAIVGFNDAPRVLVNFTDDTALLLSAVDALEARGETALWDAVRTASGMFGERPDLLASMVVLSDGADTVSQADASAAAGSASAAKAAVFAVGLHGPGDFDRVNLETLTRSTDGDYVETTDARQLGALYENIQRQIQNQVELTYTSAAETPEIEVVVSLAGLSATATAPTGTITKGSATRPAVIKAPDVPAPFRSDYALPLVVLLLIGAAGSVAAALITVIRSDKPRIDDALAPYFGLAHDFDAGPIDEEDRTLAQTALVRRAVDATARFANQRGLLDVLERRLEQADLQLRPQEALFFFVALVAVITAGGFVLGGPLAGLATLVVVGLAPVAFLNVQAGRRQRAFSAQLPDTLQLLASSMRAGYSLQQGIETVAREVSGPMGRELRRVVVESALARPLEEALGDSAERMGSPDFHWAVIAIRIQREVGGNLAELLTTVAETMISRERIRREVRALTAEGRFSAIILLALPVILGVMIFFLNPAYMAPLFGTTLGQVMIGGAGVLALVGYLWMQKIIEIKA